MVTLVRGESIHDSRVRTVADYNTTMQHPPLSIIPARLQSDIVALNAIGRDPDSGALSRPADSAALVAAYAWLARRVDAIGSGCRLDDDHVVRVAGDGVREPVVIAGGLTVPQGVGPFDDALGLVAGLEVLRCLPAAANSVVVTAGTTMPAGAKCVFEVRATSAAMLSDSGRMLGVALSAGEPLDMRRACEIGEASGVSLLPMRFVAADVPDRAGPVCTIYLDGSLNDWPLTAAAREAASQCTTVLLNLVAALV